MWFVAASDRQLAEAGTCVVMAVQNTTRANVLTEKWQFDWSKRNLPLNIEVLTYWHQYF